MPKGSSIKIFALIGYPLQHSLSPSMQNAAFKALGINAEYKLFPLEEKEIEPFFKNLKINHIHGLNVTVPYKEKVLPFLHELSREAKLIDAVNTIQVLPERLVGFNTDGQGFFQHLRQDLNFNPQDKIVAILGAGGASRAVSVYLAQARPKLIKLYDIDKIKLSALVRHLQKNFLNIEIKQANSIAELNIEQADLLVNATPYGMKETDPCLVDENFLHKDMLVYDLIYNPLETELLALAKKRGAQTSNGLGMLLYQGALSFEIFSGKAAPLEVMRQVLKERDR